MSANSLFNVVLKVFGISFIKDVLISLPALFGVFYRLGENDISGALSTLLITLLTLLVYMVVSYYFVFKTHWIIQKLKLLDKVPEDPIPLNIHRSTIVSIAILLVALYVIAEAIPLVMRELIRLYQYAKMNRGVLNEMQPFDYSLILMHIGQIVVGLLLLGYHRQLVNYIDLKTRKLNG